MDAAATFHIDLSTEDYITVLDRLHRMLAPETYLEIGSRTGDSLKLARCASIAIDPAFSISTDVIGAKPATHFHQITSDRFFAKHDPMAILGGPVEFAFLDGMHLAEFLLRDFMNVERSCRRNSVIVMHDCMPSDALMACRDEGNHDARSNSLHPGWWTGDVWKAVWALKTYRPGLRITGIDTPPTGLICITNLDPASTVLHDGYADIVGAMGQLGDSEEALQDYIGMLDIIKPSRIATFDRLSEYFYL